jgi:hypothetical protein
MRSDVVPASAAGTRRVNVVKPPLMASGRANGSTRPARSSTANSIHRIEAATNVYTVGKDGSRAEIAVMERDQQHPMQYLQTVADNTTADNLMRLPRF